jgi:lysozyme family protein
MANFELFANKLINIEGGYSDRADDRGGPTKYGVILSTWKAYGYDKNGDGIIDAEDIKELTTDDARWIAKKIFWDFFRADEIKNQSIAEFLCDWGYNSGNPTVARILQRILRINVDGKIGPDTIKLINSSNQKTLFDRLKLERQEFVKNIVLRDPSQIANLRGWLNRINKFFFTQTENQAA